MPDVCSEPVPDDPLWVQLEASGDPLMKQLAAHLRASQAREDTLQRQLDKQAKEAAARQAVRDFDRKGVSAFHFNASDVKRALDKFVVPCMFEESGRQFYSQLQVTPDTQDFVTRAFASVTKLPESYRNKIFQRRLRDSYLSTKPRELSKGDKLFYSKEQLAKDKTFGAVARGLLPSSAGAVSCSGFWVQRVRCRPLLYGAVH